MVATSTTPLSALFARIKAEMVALGVWYSSPTDEAAMRMWLKTAWLDCGCNTDFAILTQPGNKLSIQFSVRVATSGHRVNVYWGDGTTSSVAPSTSSNTSLSKTYATGALRPIVILGGITHFVSDNSDGRTAFGGRIRWLRKLKTLYVTGSNTLSGSIAGLTSLTVLRIDGSNTISGSVTGLTSLTYLIVTGSNTISGFVTGLTSLTDLIVYGSNTLSGSVAGLTSLTALRVYGSNTISGWGSIAASAIGLCQLTHGGLTVLDATEVNAVLAGFWANRDAAKSKSERVIDIGKDTPTPNGAPTGQGIIDKAALAAYKSPNNTGPAVWTVTTN